MLDQKIAQEVIDCALSTGGDFAEIFYEDRLNNGVIILVPKFRVRGDHLGIYVLKSF